MNERNLFWMGLSIFAAVLAFGCGGGGGGAGAAGSTNMDAGASVGSTGGNSGATAGSLSSGLDPARMISELDDTEVRDLCDWSNAQHGGYAHAFACDGGTVTTDPSQQSCIDDTKAVQAACTLTVGEVESCVRATMPDFCVLLAYPPECSALLQCASRL